MTPALNPPYGQIGSGDGKKMITGNKYLATLLSLVILAAACGETGATSTTPGTSQDITAIPSDKVTLPIHGDWLLLKIEETTSTGEAILQKNILRFVDGMIYSIAFCKIGSKQVAVQQIAKAEYSGSNTLTIQESLDSLVDTSIGIPCEAIGFDAGVYSYLITSGKLQLTDKVTGSPIQLKKE
jgi:hypothetical protein